MIVCFSGCGNSRYAAELLASRLGERVTTMDVASVHPILDASVEGRIIWVSPVHSWGLPPAVRRFIRNVSIEGTTGGIPHFLMCSCGDDAGLTASQWRKDMRRRGFRTVSAHTVIMPNTYVFLPGFDVDNGQTEKSKLEAVPSRIADIAHAIKCKSPIDSVTKGRFAWLKTHIVYPFFMRFLTSPKGFGASDACVGCGVCVRECPMENITLDPVSMKPVWGKECAFCSGCYHRCPHNAISYGRMSKGKGQYYCRAGSKK